MAAPAATAPEETKPAPKPTPKPKPAYEYLFAPDKGPTKTLDALLRAIAQHISTNIGDKNEQALTPKKLAAFYHAVGGDYDDLFLKAPNESISYIWQVTGCQHILLQPSDDDYKAPCIPALTPKGFVRWQSIEILLLPDDHAPYIQHAVKNWNLKDPETGVPFPAEIPREVFPEKTDAEVDTWHKRCAEQLRKEATPRPEETRGGPGVGSAGPSSAEARAREAYSHVRFGSGAPRPRTSTSPRPQSGDYFNSRPIFNHVPSRSGVPGGPRSAGLAPNFAPTSAAAAAAAATLSPDQAARRGSSPDPRRRSFSDWPPSSSSGPNYASGHHDDEPPPRRHSNPRHYSPPHSSGTEESPAGSASPRNGSRRRRDVPPHAPEAPDGPIHFSRSDEMFQSSNGSQRRRRRHSPGPGDDHTDEDIAPTSLRHKVVNKAKGFLPSGLVGAAAGLTGIGTSPTEERIPRSSSGSRNGRLRHSREDLPGKTGLNRAWSMGVDGEEIHVTPASGSEGERKARRRREKEREREELGDREWQRARERERERNADDSDHERPASRRRKQIERERELREREREREGRYGRPPHHHHLDRDRDHGPYDREHRWDDERDRGERPRSRRDRGERERDRERDRDSRDSGRYIPRPEVNRRTSSHADVDRRRRERERDFMDLDPDGRSERRRWDSRDRTGSPPDPGLDRMPTGVGGRRYPKMDI